MDNRWWSGETQVLDRGEVVSAAEGNAAWLLMMAEGSQLSDGSYRIELSENGMLVTTIPLRIGNCTYRHRVSSIDDAVPGTQVFSFGEWAVAKTVRFRIGN